jgi:hypothetical protein
MTAILYRLGTHGARYEDPVAAVDWTAVDPNLPWLPPHLLSLAGLEVQAAMSREALLRFSRIEFARLCAAGLWLEGLLISRVTARGFLGAAPAEARVVLQEVREESGHGLMFLEMIERAGLAGVPLLGPTGLLTWVAHRLDPKDAAFWAMVYIGESVTDRFAVHALRAAAEPGGAICPLAGQVLALHHRDEARHIAAARALLEARIGRMTAWRRRLFARTLRFLLRRFLRATLYPTVASLAALGLAEPRAVARAARACPERRQLARDCAAPALALVARDALAEPLRAGDIRP